MDPDAKGGDLMPDITVADCEKLYQKFLTYTETAEQHEFALLAMVNVRLDHSRQRGWKMPQDEARAMFRVVLRVIGEDFSAYEEE